MATIELKPEEALVLFHFVHRFRDHQELAIAHPAEENLLWDLCAILEDQVPVLDPNYAELLESARLAVADPNWE